MKRKKVYKCNHCRGKLIENTDLFIYQSKTYNLDVLKCEKCHTTVTDLFALKKLRQEIKPTFFERIRNVLHLNKDVKTDLSFFRGKVL